jgi:GDP-L-fucose synthase
MKKESVIFVAGGTGLVGSAIINTLLEKGYTNVISNYRHRKPRNDAIKYYPLDLTKQQNVEYFFETFKPEYVFLAAAKVGGIVANNTYRAEFIYSNLVIQNNVIDISYRYGVKKLLFLGSTCIYPKECPQPMKEEYLLTGELEYTNEPYAIAKIAGIKMCESYNLQYGTNYISVMPTNLYGPNDNFDLEKSHVLPALIRKIHCAKLLNEKKYDEVIQDLGVSTLEEAKDYLARFGVNENRVEIWGSGKPKREFLWSEDMADACVFLMENRDFKDTYMAEDGSNTTCSPNEVKNQEIRNTHINIGTGIDISIKELAETIKEIVGFQGELYFNTDKPDGTMKKLSDPSKLHALGWKHKVELHEGIEKMYAWYTGERDS